MTYLFTDAVNPSRPDGRPINGTATTVATKMHILGSVSQQTMDVDYVVDGTAEVIFAGSQNAGGELTQASTYTPHAGATLAETVSGLTAAYASGSISTETQLSPLSAPEHIKVTYAALTFSVNGVDYVADGSYLFQPLTGTTAAGSGEVVVSQNGNKVGRIFADAQGVHIDVGGKVFKP